MRLTDYNSRRFGFAAGVGAAIVMLVSLGVLRLLSGVLSLPEVIAEGILLLLPGAVFSAVLDTLQHAAKPLFYLAIVIGMLVSGGVLGRWYGERPGWRQAAQIVIGAWLLFGLVVYTVLGAGPFGQQLQAGAVWHGATLALQFAVYGVALVFLHRMLARRQESASASSSRRQLLVTAGAALVGVVAVGAAWRLLGGTSEVAAEPNAAPFDLEGLSPEVTPNERFYTVSKNFIDPVVAEGSWRLKIDGLVDRPLELTYEQLTALPSSEGYYTLMCISNEVGGGLWGNAYWRGVKLRDLLMQAGVHTDAYKAVFTAADDYKDSVVLERALHPETLLAWEMNGEPLRREHGYPARLLIPGIYGMKNVKWLSGISIVADDFKGFWQKQGWNDAAPYQTESRIDVPRGRISVDSGALAIGGIAFAGERGIQTVEISTDQGRTWQPARLKPALSANTWQLWRADVNVDRNVKDLRVRAVDGTGTPQRREETPPFPSGATGYHVVTVAVS